MAKKLTTDIKMVGQIYMKPTGEIYSLYGGWHKYQFAKIPTNTPLYKQIVETYGTSKGAKIRAMAINRLLKGSWGVKK